MRKIILLVVVILIYTEGCSDKEGKLRKRVNNTITYSRAHYTNSNLPAEKAMYKKLNNIAPKNIKGKHILVHVMLIIRKNKEKILLLSWLADIPKADGIKIILKDHKSTDLYFFKKEIEANMESAKDFVCFSNCFNSKYDSLPNLNYVGSEVVLLSKGKVISNELPMIIFDYSAPRPIQKLKSKN